MEMIGQYLKQLRKDKGLNLKDVALRVGVTTSFLSQVENGKTSPSLSTLKLIANALDTTIGHLMGEQNPKEENNILRRGEGRRISDAAQGIKIELLTSPDPFKQMEPLYFTLDQNAGAGEGAYQHYGQEFLLVIKGSLEVTLNTTRYTLKQGDSMYFNSRTPHTFRNIDKATTEVVWVVTPPSF